MAERQPPTLSAELEETDLSVYQQILEAAEFVIFRSDAQGFYSEISNSVEKLTGYTADELVGKHLTELIVSEWRESVEAVYAEQYRESIAQTQLELPIVTKSGQIKWVLQTLTLLSPATENAVMGGIIQDISQHKQTEQDREAIERHYKGLFEQTNDGICIFNLDGCYITVNQSMADMLGYTVEELVGKPVSLTLPPDELPDVQQKSQTLLNGGTLDIYERLFQKKTGEIFPVEVNAILVRDSEGKPSHFQLLVRDITERKRVEQERAEIEQQYKGLFEQANDAIFIMSLDCYHIAVNQKAADMLGYTVDELLGGPGEVGVAPDELESAWGIFEALKAGETIPVYERTLRKKTGEEFPGEVNASLVRDVNGQPLHIQTVIRDITERKQAEQALAASERRNRALIEAVPDVIMVMRKDGLCVDFRPGINDELGLAHETMIGVNVRDFGFGEGFANQMLNYIQRTIETGEVQAFDFVLNYEEEQYYDTQSVALNSDEVVIILRNVTERKHAEQEMNEHIEQLTALRRVDTELADKLNVQYVLNLALDSAVRLSAADMGMIGLFDDETGELRLAHCIGGYDHAVVDIYLKEQHGIIAEVVAQQRAKLIPDINAYPNYASIIPGVMSQIVLPLISQDRLVGIISLETMKSRLFTPDMLDFLQLLAARVAVAVDNARLYQTTEAQLKELQSLYERLRKLEKLKTDMIRIASHDLRAPLTTISGFLQLMEMELEDAPNPVLSEKVSSIKRANQRMMRMISDILSLERIEESAQQDAGDIFDLRDMIETVYQEHMSQAELRQQDLQQVLPDTSVEIKGDPIQIHEAIANLIGNALKYTPDQGRIEVRLWRTETEAVFEVEDTGYGIPESQQGRIFELFFRANTAENKTIDGSGMGLHLVRNIVERHDGQIELESAPGEGSTFRVTLPLVQ